MKNQRLIPDDPLEFVKKCFRGRKIFWTYHVNMRLEERSVSRQVILSSIDNLQVIEEYPEDKYFPSYLLLSHCAGTCCHILVAADVAGNNIRVITAYLPSPDKWEADFKTRRDIK